MATLTVTVVSALGTPISGKVIRAELVDSRGNPVQGFDGELAYIAPSVVASSASGVASLELTPNADITPLGTYYSVTVGDARSLILKTSDTQTLLEALASPLTDL